MTNFLKQGIIFIKNNPAILSSIALVIIVPLSLYFCTSFLVKSFQQNIDFILQRKALMVESIFSIYAVEHYNEPQELEAKVQQIALNNPEIANLKIYLPSGEDNFEIIAYQAPKKDYQPEVSETSLLLAWHKNQAIAYLSQENGERFWNVIKPFYDENGQKLGLISIAMSLQETDNLIFQKIKQVYIFLLIAIVLVLLLILQHTRLFQYVNLFKKLREVDRAKDSFMNMAIHELRSPVVNIRGYIRELQEELGPQLKPEQKEDLYRIEISAKRLNDLISDILDVVRIEQGRLSFIPQKVSPVEIAKEVITELQLKAKEAGLSLELIEKEGSSLLVYVNPNRLREVLFNLIDNAIKYTKKGGIKVIIRGDEIKGKLYIIVEDTGIGISAEEQKKIFERFYRVRTRETADVPGTGLGLWIVKQLCKKMKGDILVESIKGVGSRFTVVLPAIKE